MKRKSLTPNSRHGRLRLISPFRKAYKNGVFNNWWMCECDCGQLINIIQTSLTKKKPTKSCGCIRIEAVGKWNRRGLGVAAKSYRLRVYKKKARIRKLPFKLSNKKFFELTQESCHYCGINPYRSSMTKGNHFYGDFIYNGIDRIDSTKGYTINNCVPCCSMCNKGKCDSSYKEFIHHLDQIAKFRRKLI